MQTLPIYQVDVFAERLFAGNPAAVCPLRAWLPDGVMQSIGAENNLAETAFFVADETGAADFLLRWFTPSIEIELCGHATLASGHVLFNELGAPGSSRSRAARGSCGSTFPPACRRPWNRFPPH